MFNGKINAILWICGLFFMLATPLHAWENRIVGGVQTSTAMNERGKGETARIEWRQKADARIDLLICDLDGRIVRTLHEKKQLAAGDNAASWDGRDDKGQPCPTGAYLPIIKADHPTLGYEVMDPSAGKWGQRVIPQDLAYDAQSGQITYSLDQPAICLIRVGEKDGGPMYRTLAQWVPRAAGPHAEPWDGWDEKKVVEVFSKEKFHIILDAIALPENAILLHGNSTAAGKTDYEIYPLTPPVGTDIFLHTMHSRQKCHDFPIHVGLTPARKKSGIAQVKDTVTFEVDIEDKYLREVMLKEGLEIYLFLDGEFIFEGQTPTLPGQLQWDTRTAENGPHIITINLRAMEDHVGTRSIRVNVNN